MSAETETGRGIGFWIAFWAPGLLALGLLLRHLFKEQLNELRTLRFLTKNLAPFFPEFDVEALQKWVALCAPHVWHGWRRRDFSSLGDFATPELLAKVSVAFDEEARRGEHFDGELGRVLKLHPLGLRLVPHAHGEPPPAGIELVLRLEVHASDARRAPDGRLVSGSATLHQLQQFWTLRHDGRRWQLHDLAPATRERGDLPPPTALPALMQWKTRAPTVNRRGDDETIPE